MDEFLMTLKEFFAHPSVILFGAITLIEVVPIKINPWRSLLKWMGDAVNAEDRKNIKEIKNELTQINKTVEGLKIEREQDRIEHEQDKAKEKRWHILDFVNSCRHGRTHTREEWNHTLSELAEYEQFTADKKIPNGVIEEGAKYLRELYHENNRTNNFL